MNEMLPKLARAGAWGAVAIAVYSIAGCRQKEAAAQQGVLGFEKYNKAQLLTGIGLALTAGATLVALAAIIKGKK